LSPLLAREKSKPRNGAEEIFGLLCARDQAFQELDKNIGVDAGFFLDHEPHVAARSDR
jgi:hypothetical protein